MLDIRPALVRDIDAIMEIFCRARAFMAAHGNPGQWTGGYPSRELLLSEIAASHCFVCTDGRGDIAGTFCFIIGEDPTYRLIEQGAWLSAASFTLTTARPVSHTRSVSYGPDMDLWNFLSGKAIRI